MWAFGVLVLCNTHFYCLTHSTVRSLIFFIYDGQAYIALTGVHPFDPKGDRSDAEIVTEIASGEYDGNAFH